MKWETWTRKDGSRVSVGDMSEEHLRNTLNMLLRKRRVKLEEAFAKIVRKEIRDTRKYWND